LAPTSSGLLNVLTTFFPDAGSFVAAGFFINPFATFSNATGINTNGTNPNEIPTNASFGPGTLGTLGALGDTATLDSNFGSGIDGNSILNCLDSSGFGGVLGVGGITSANFLVAAGSFIILVTGVYDDTFLAAGAVALLAADLTATLLSALASFKASDARANERGANALIVASSASNTSRTWMYMAPLAKMVFA
jgi:hypothetical protein